MLESAFFDVNNHYEPNATAPVWPVPDPEGRSADTASPPRPAWFTVRLTLADGARIDVLAAMSAERITVEEVRADLPLDGFTAVAEWAEGPAGDRRAVGAPRTPVIAPDGPQPPPVGRARPSWPGGRAGRRIAAQAYRAAQQAGRDPVLAVMCATGRSRRKSLRLIAGARDEGLLSPRHNRR
ncbi:DUF6214 family protein [Streptomyces enissocaesilis]|uniref:DUF6214 family protein n=1 Tax=Streptomyces enissocaesilis TaxID=332589 RepID=UPI0031D15AB7